jgi:hypothetical protein
MKKEEDAPQVQQIVRNKRPEEQKTRSRRK